MRRKIIAGVGVVLALCVLWIAMLWLTTLVVKSRVPVELRPFVDIAGVGDYISATGTWAIDGQKQAFPLQITTVWCEKELKRCTGSTAQVMLRDQLHVDLGFYEIVEWGKGHVTFIDDSPACVRYLYTIDLITKTANGVRQRREKPTIKCDDIEKGELRLTLRGGSEVNRELQQEAMPWFGRIAAAPLKLLW